MSQLDALALAASLRERLVDFASDDAFVRDDRLAAMCRRLWGGPAGGGGLLGDIWVEGAFPARSSGTTLAQLVAERRFDAALAGHLDRPTAIPADRPLYDHQEAAIRASRASSEQASRPALVISAGTGAGKTESFLLPTLDDLYSYPRHGTGVRCLILYPMNALVNDQVDRLYGWLRGQDRVTLFHFTG